MKLKLSILIITVLLAQISFSQILLNAQSAEAILEHYEKLMISGDSSQPIDIAATKGSPFLNDSFLSGSVFIPASNQTLGYQMRYNIYNDQMEVQNTDDNSLSALLKNSDYIYKILDKTFIYLGYQNKKGSLRKGFFQELSNGKKVSLLVKYFCLYKPKTMGKPPVYQDIPAKFVTTKAYYILVDNKLSSITTNKRKLLDSFGSFKNKIKSYISKNNLKVDKERDLIRIISYYDSLLSE